MQQAFIEHLLTGKSFTQAARLAGVSRRAACYWFESEDHPVRAEYEKQRALALAEFDTRVARLHELAFEAMEDLLSAKTPPFIRVQMVRLLYETTLQEHCSVRTPQASGGLVQRAIDAIYDEMRSSLAVYLYDTENRRRLND